MSDPHPPAPADITTPDAPPVPLPPKEPPAVTHPGATFDTMLLQTLGQVAVTTLEQYGQQVATAAEAQRDTARINAEWRASERSHEVELQRLSDVTTQKSLELDGAQHSRRERTIRVMGAVTVVGIFAYLLIALENGKIQDPLQALPTLATVVGFLMLLVKQVFPKAPE